MSGVLALAVAMSRTSIMKSPLFSYLVTACLSFRTSPVSSAVALVHRYIALTQPAKQEVRTSRGTVKWIIEFEFLTRGVLKYFVTALKALDRALSYIP